MLQRTSKCICSNEHVSCSATDEYNPGDSRLGMTFRDSKQEPVYNWYPYVEGFSAEYLKNLILRLSVQPSAIYDPFGGCGTTQLTASLSGIKSYFSEINPFMTFVAETKIVSSAWARNNYKFFCKEVDDFIKRIQKSSLKSLSKHISLNEYYAAFPGRDFFEEKDIRELLAIKQMASQYSCETHLYNILMLSCAANAVSSSNMTRRADLRRRKPGEYKNRVVDVPSSVCGALLKIVRDVSTLPPEMEKTMLVSEDCRVISDEYDNAFDLSITSPPYLNGTNYFRNTKIELWLLDFIKSEKDLSGFTSRALTAGINNVTKKQKLTNSFEFVENVAMLVSENASDKRIALLIRHYFSDMYEAFCSLFKVLKSGGHLVLDIGDSKFYGVHIPTDTFLCKIGVLAGFELVSRQVIARRHSRDKTPLVQSELVFIKK